MDMIKNEKKLDKVIKSGEVVLDKLDILINSLNNVKKWGCMDIFSKDLLPTLIKHRKLKKCEAISKEVEKSITLFKNELGELDIRGINLEKITPQLKMADYLLGIMGNIYVQEKIEENIEKVKEVYREMELCVNGLKIDLDKLRQQQ